MIKLIKINSYASSINFDGDIRVRVECRPQDGYELAHNGQITVEENRLEPFLAQMTGKTDFIKHGSELHHMISEIRYIFDGPDTKAIERYERLLDHEYAKFKARPGYYVGGVDPYQDSYGQVQIMARRQGMVEHLKQHDKYKYPKSLEESYPKPKTNKVSDEDVYYLLT